MKNLNLKPLYIFLAIVGVAWVFKLTQPEKNVAATLYHFESNGTCERENLERAEQVKKDKEEIRKEAAQKEMDVIFPGEK
jgi:hypothetical protein